MIFNADTSARVTASNTTLPVGAVRIIGSTAIAAIPGPALPTVAGGFAKTACTWNLWPRDGTLPTGFGQISDFAPDNGNLGVTVIGAVPGPTAALPLAAGLAGLSLRAGRRVRSR